MVLWSKCRRVCLILWLWKLSDDGDVERYIGVGNAYGVIICGYIISLNVLRLIVFSPEERVG